jgi:hypothetical protein
VAGNDLRAVVDLREDALDAAHDAAQRAAARQIDEWVPGAHVHVAHVHHVRAPEVHRRVAVRVRRGQVNRRYLVAVDVERHGIVEGDDRQGARRCGQLLALDELDELPSRHAPADVVVGDEQRAGLAHVLVAAGVIEVPVGIEDEPHRPVGQRGDGGEDLGRQGRELVVDDEDRVGTDGESDVAAGAVQDVDALSESLRSDLDRVEGLCRRVAG